MLRNGTRLSNEEETMWYHRRLRNLFSGSPRHVSCGGVAAAAERRRLGSDGVLGLAACHLLCTLAFMSDEQERPGLLRCCRSVVGAAASSEEGLVMCAGHAACARSSCAFGRVSRGPGILAGGTIGWIHGVTCSGVPVTATAAGS